MISIKVLKISLLLINLPIGLLGILFLGIGISLLLSSSLIDDLNLLPFPLIIYFIPLGLLSILLYFTIWNIILKSYSFIENKNIQNIIISFHKFKNSFYFSIFINLLLFLNIFVIGFISIFYFKSENKKLGYSYEIWNKINLYLLSYFMNKYTCCGWNSVDEVFLNYKTVERFSNLSSINDLNNVIISPSYSTIDLNSSNLSDLYVIINCSSLNNVIIPACNNIISNQIYNNSKLYGIIVLLINLLLFFNFILILKLYKLTKCNLNSIKNCNLEKDDTKLNNIDDNTNNKDKNELKLQLEFPLFLSKISSSIYFDNSPISMTDSYNHNNNHNNSNSSNSSTSHSSSSSSSSLYSPSSSTSSSSNINTTTLTSNKINNNENSILSITESITITNTLSSSTSIYSDSSTSLINNNDTIDLQSALSNYMTPDNIS